MTCIAWALGRSQREARGAAHYFLSSEAAYHFLPKTRVEEYSQIEVLDGYNLLFFWIYCAEYVLPKPVDCYFYRTLAEIAYLTSALRVLYVPQAYVRKLSAGMVDVGCMCLCFHVSDTWEKRDHQRSNS